MFMDLKMVHEFENGSQILKNWNHFKNEYFQI